MGLDGLWDESVVLQIKNGPMDFQTHEPVHSLFGNLMKTKIMVEFGVTQEYTGQAYHLCNLISQWESYLSFDTGCPLNNSGSALLADVLTKGNNSWGFAGVAILGGDFGREIYYLLPTLSAMGELHGIPISRQATLPWSG